MEQIKEIIGEMPEKIDIFYKNLIDFLKRVDNFINYICVSIFYKSKQDGGLRKSINKRNKILKSRKYN
jgi:effector-binding domain-containing protein